MATSSELFRLFPDVMLRVGNRLTRLPVRSCWRNGGLGETPEYWQDMGVGGPLGGPVFLAKGMGDIRGVRFGTSYYHPVPQFYFTFKAD